MRASIRVRPRWRWLLSRLAMRLGRGSVAFRLCRPCVLEIREPGRVIRRPLFVFPSDPDND